MATSVVEFLDGKGAAELLVKIDPNGSRRNELRGLINVAPNPLTKRLNEGREAGVIETEAIDELGETGHKYVMTPKGARLRMVLEEEGMDDLYDQIETYRAQLEEAIDETKEWTKDHYDELSDKQENWRILAYYQTNPWDFEASSTDDSERDA